MRSSVYSTRRTFLAQSTALLTTAAVANRLRANPCGETGLSLGFSLYGMQTVPVLESLRAIKKIGYESVELCLLDGFPTDPKQLDADARQQIRETLAEQSLCLAALMENLPISDQASINAGHRERLRRAAELAHALAPQRPPVIETVLGGKDWNAVRDRFAEELLRWGELADQYDVVIAIKAHRNNALDRPDYVTWLLQQVNHPRIRLVYDYSHFAFREMPMEQTLRDLLPYTAFIHVKDTIIEGNAARFALPATTDGIDYQRMGGLLRELDYRGSVCVEVSSQVWKQPGYEPLEAARVSYAGLSTKLALAN